MRAMRRISCGPWARTALHPSRTPRGFRLFEPAAAPRTIYFDRREGGLPIGRPSLPALALAPLLATDGDGILQAIVLVGASELGDKTFFLSAIIAMREGRSVAFLGSMSALTALTGVSVGIGQAFQHTPLLTTLPVGDMLATSMFTYFGAQMLREARAAAISSAAHSVVEQEAVEAIAERQRGESASSGGARWWPAFATAFGLVFVAEVGDKSMFATIALARDFGASEVFVGAIFGHCLATGLAVVGGSTASKYVSPVSVNMVGGVLFLLFAAGTARSMLLGESDDS